MHDTSVTPEPLQSQNSVSFLKNAPKLLWKKTRWRLRGKTDPISVVKTRHWKKSAKLIPHYEKKRDDKILDRQGQSDLKICPIFTRAHPGLKRAASQLHKKWLSLGYVHATLPTQSKDKRAVNMLKTHVDGFLRLKIIQDTVLTGLPRRSSSM